MQSAITTFLIALTLLCSNAFGQKTPVLWLRADSVVLNGLQVARVLDASGNGKDAYQNNAAQQPLFVDSVALLNNKPVIRLNKANSNFLQIDSAVTVGEIYIVANY